MRRFDPPEENLALHDSYEAISGSTAWIHYQSKLHLMRERLEKSILMGERTRDGRDLTEAMRSAYGIVLEMLAIPEEIRVRKETDEQQLMGYKPEPGTWPAP